MRVRCTTCCGRNAKCAQRGVAQHALSTHPSGQGAQWPWAARPLWVPAGQGLGVTVPAGQKCPEREADQICQSHSKPHSLALRGPNLNPVPGGPRGPLEASGQWKPQNLLIPISPEPSSGQPLGVPAGHGPPVRSPSELSEPLGTRAPRRQKKPGLQSPEGLARPAEPQ